MLFNLNKLHITPDSFRLLYHIMTEAYYDKMINTTHGELEKATEMSKHKIRAALNELRTDKLIHTESFTTGIRITLMPVLVEMIYKDSPRKKASQKTNVMNEIKKFPGRKKPEGSSSQTSQKSSTETSTQKPRPIISKHSSKNTSTVNATTATPTKPAKPAKKTNTPPSQTPKPTTTKQKNRVPRGSAKKPYMTTRGKLYTYFESWLRLGEAMSNEQVNQLLKNEAELEKFWNKFRNYAARTWLPLQKVSTNPETDLNKIKFMRQIALVA